MEQCEMSKGIEIGEGVYWDSMYKAKGLIDGKSCDLNQSMPEILEEVTFPLGIRHSACEEPKISPKQLQQKTEHHDATSAQLQNRSLSQLAQATADRLRIHEKEALQQELPSRPPTPSWAYEEADVAASKTTEVPREPTLTQEELDHIAYIQKLAEETSFAVEPPPRPAPPSVTEDERRKDSFVADEADQPRYAAELESEESQATSGADEELASDMGSPAPIYERTSPLLEERKQEHVEETSFDEVDHRETAMPEVSFGQPIPSWAYDEADVAASKTTEVPREPTLTQEELDHIAYIQKLAEETSFAVEPPPRPAPPSVTEDERRKDSFVADEADQPRYAAELESEESQATSGADEELASDMGSPAPIYERTSPLLEERKQEHVEETSFDEVDHRETAMPEVSFGQPIPSWAYDEADVAASKTTEVPREPTLTQEELDHIAYIQKLAEETSFAVEPPPRPAPPSVTEDERRKDSFVADEADQPRYAAELESEESQATSGADEELASDMGSPAPIYERTSPLLEERKQEHVEETSFDEVDHRETAMPEVSFGQPIPSWAYDEADVAASKTTEVPREPTLTQEELDHIAYIQKLAEETSFAVEPPSQTPSLQAAAFAQSEVLTQEELDHIAYIQKLAEETSFAVEPPSQTPSLQAAAFAQSEVLTQEELDHIAYIQKLAEETSFAVEPPPRPAPPSVTEDERRKDSFVADEADQPRYAAELESEESQATSGADEELASDMGSPAPIYERTSPLLEERKQEHVEETSFDEVDHRETAMPEVSFGQPIPSWAYDEADVAASKQTEVPREPTLTQEELDHIAYIQKLAEETSFAVEPPSQTPSLQAAAFAQSEVLTQEELDHIAYIQKLAEETSFAVEPPPRPAPPSVTEDERRKDSFVADEADQPRYAAELESEESQATSGADEELASDMGSPAPIYERTSPLLEERKQEHVEETSFDEVDHRETAMPEVSFGQPIPSWAYDEADVAASKTTEVPREPTLTQEELDHIAYIQKLAEETSFAVEPPSQTPSLQAAAFAQSEVLTQEELDHIAYIQKLAEETSFAVEPPPRPAPPSVTEDERRKDSFVADEADQPRYAAELESEESQATSGADEELASDMGSPAPIYERTSPLLEERKQEHVEETSFDEVDHRETAMPEVSFGQPIPSWAYDEADVAASKTTEVPREPTLTQEELDHIAYIQKLAEETSFAVEPPSQTPSLQAAAFAQSEVLTQEELDHIAYIQKLAEETSFAVEPPPRPAPPSVTEDERRKDSFVADEADQPRYAAELESEESQATSGADEELASDMGSPAPIYERTSPLLEERKQEHVEETSFDEVDHRETAMPEVSFGQPIPSWAYDEADVAASKTTEVPREPTLTQEELDHIAYIQKLAEETSFAVEPPSQTPSLQAAAFAQSEVLTQEELDHTSHTFREARRGNVVRS
ncbi:hypothetical protein OSTOST_06123 [Ostertagia ostertagi]